MTTKPTVINSEFTSVNRRLLEEVAAAYRSACIDVAEPDKLRHFFETHYDARAYFRDPLFEGHGYEGVLKYCHMLSRAVEALRVEQWETLAEKNRIALRWIVAVKLRYWPFELRLAGVTLLSFDKEVKCVEHVEYWDLLNALLNVVPVIPRLTRLAPRRIREHLVFLRQLRVGIYLRHRLTTAYGGSIHLSGHWHCLASDRVAQMGGQPESTSESTSENLKQIATRNPGYASQSSNIPN